MDDEAHQVIGFGIDYGNELIYCEAVMQHDHYDIHFNGVLVGSVAHNGDFESMLASGKVLPQSIIDEIGFKIESHYK
jgi:hypothetical protein